jgi:hypothetical protein
MECHISIQVPAFYTQSCNLDAKDPVFFLKNSTGMVAGLSEFVVTVHHVFMTLLGVHRVFVAGSDCHSVTPT